MGSEAGTGLLSQLPIYLVLASYSASQVCFVLFFILKTCLFLEVGAEREKERENLRQTPH